MLPVDARPNFPVYYRQFKDKDLPPYIEKRGLNGMLYIPKKYLESGYGGPYQVVTDFGHDLESLRGTVPSNRRIKVNSMPNVRFLGFEDTEIVRNMSTLSHIANNGSPENSTDREAYREALGYVYKKLAIATIPRIIGKKTLILPPLNGGQYVRDVFREILEDQPIRTDFFNYRLSRIITTEGNLMVGAVETGRNPKIAEYNSFWFADDCLASFASAWKTLKLIFDNLRRNKKDPAKCTVNMTVSAASQTGLEALLLDAQQFGFASINVVAALPIPSMNDHYYLLNPDGSLAVGDMGELSRRPD